MKPKGTLPDIVFPVTNKNRAINTTIAIICIGLIILTWIRVNNQLRFEKQEAINNAIQQNTNRVISFEQYISRTLESINAATKFIKREFERQGNKVQISELIKAEALDTSMFKIVNLIDGNGRLASSSYPEKFDQALNIQDSQFRFHLLKDMGEMHISGPAWVPWFDQNLIPISRRLNKPDGTFAGIIFMLIEPTHFTRLFEKVALGPLDVSSLLKPDGITIARLTGSKQSTGEDIIKSPLFTEIKKHPEGNYYAKNVITGLPTYFSFKTIQNYSLIATVGKAEGDVLSNFNKRRTDYITLASTLNLIIILFALLLIRALNRRKQLEVKLRQSEMRFRSLIENNHDALILRDKNFNTFYCSPSAERLLKWDKKENLSKHIKDLLHPDDLKKMNEVKEIVFAKPGIPVPMTMRMKNISNDYIWAEGVMTNLLNDNNVNAIISNFRDITERKKAEDEIKESEAKYRAFFENSMDGILLTELNGKILSANPSACKIFNMTEKEICAAARFTLVDDEDPRVHELINQREKTGRAKGELTFVRKGDIKFPGEIASMVFTDAFGRQRTCMIIRDITERKMGEEKLIESNERFINVSKATFDIIWDWDVKSRQLYFGDGFEKILGYKLADNIGDFTTWADHIHPEDKERVINNRFNKLIHYDQLTWKDEYRYLRADGTIAYILDKGILLREEGSTNRMIGAMQDVTDAKENEIAIKELNQKLEEKARELLLSNKELERFAYVASHDLQEPLRMVNSFLQLLNKKYTDQLDETAKKYIDFAIDGSQRMKTLINDLLEYSRLNAEREVTIVNVNDILIKATTALKFAIEESNAQIIYDNLPKVEGNALQLTQLFQNLISNALKYKGDKKPIIKIGYEETETGWKFSIKDNGIGMEQKNLDKIFIIFQRLHSKKEYSGTGIGLALCKKIVELHSGTIWVESALGEGSTFYFTISRLHSQTSAIKN